MELHFKPNGKPRKEMVAVISKELNIKAIYKFTPTYSYEIGCYTVHRDGHLSFPDDTELWQSSAVIDACVMAGFEPEEWDRNPVEPEEPAEVVEPAEQEANSLTVELPRSQFTDSQLENLEKLVAAKAPLLKQALGREDLPIVVTDEKVSFPWFGGDIEPDACTAYTRLITDICKMAQTAKRVTAKEKEVENAKYAFRCFLLRLGWIGDEYKQSRKLLMKNFTGSAAFKSGHKKGGDNHELS